MKKYVKPELFYERYELAQHIADCQWEMTQADKENCVAEPDSNMTGMPTLFTEEPRCGVDDEGWENYCYHTGKDGDLKVFVS